MFKSALNDLLTLRDLMRFSVSRFNEARLHFGHGTDNAWDEAAYLLLHSLHLPLDRLEPFMDARLTLKERERALSVIERRVQERVPAAYITHEAWLGEYRFYVDSRVIVPRSHIAELLDEQLAPWVTDPWAVGRVLDMCTGSACLAILAAFAFPEANIDAVDISSDALAVAERNVEDYVLQSRVSLLNSDGFASLSETKYDLILSNPPYVDDESMLLLPDEYRAEPDIALAGGGDGLDFVRTLFKGARQHLSPQGFLVVEIGHNKDVLEAAFPETPFVWLETRAGSDFVFLLRQKDLPALS